MVDRILAFVALLPAGASLYFFVFWRWFDFWRRHRALTYAFMIGTFAALGGAIFAWREAVFAHRIAMPGWLVVAGWVIIAAANLLGFVADRQLGMRVRAFVPFFHAEERIALRTSGAYAIVRHPIYASGIYFQIGGFLVTGYLAVLLASAIFVAGALWFTRQEERRLVERLADPAEYARYRERVPALVPRLWRRR